MMRIEEVFSGFSLYERHYPDYAVKARDNYQGLKALSAMACYMPGLLPVRSAKYVFSGNVSYFGDVLSLCAIGEAAALTTGGRTHLKAMKSGLNSHFVIDLYSGLEDYLLAPARGAKRIQANITRLTRLLTRIGPDFLFIQSDTMPFERQFILAARSAGIRTVCVQHGIFSRQTPPELIEGKAADIFLAYDEDQAEIVRDGSPACNVLVSGSLKRNSAKLPKSNDKTLVFLGQPYPLLFGAQKGEVYVKLVKDMAERCAKSGMGFRYKPHPGELGSDYLAAFPHLLVENVDRVFGQYQRFAGLSSTTLHQASLHGKIAAQIFEPQLQIERFADLGYCYTYERHELNRLITEIGSLPPFTSSSLSTFEKGNLSERWEKVKKMLEDYRKPEA